MKDILSNLIFSKFGLVAIVVLILYLTGGFNIITNNPMIVVFLIIALAVLNVVGGK